jgi:putative ABC transport system permease protein
MGPHLQKLLADKGLDVEIKNWEEMSHFYRKVRDMFNVIFLFLFLIVFVIVVMSVVNTISMSVLERTREIGTLRALGLKRIGIINLFAVESALMGVFGSAFGALITVVTWWIIKVVEPTWVPPQITQRIPLEVYLAPSYMIASFVFLIILSIGAATAPARKAAHTSIVEALGHT